MIFDLIVGASTPTANDPNALFAAGEQGVWYDFSDLSTMFQDRAGTTPVTADGQTVGKILDKSGRGNHATAPTDAARPLYKTSGGLHWLQFNGTNQSMETASINFTATDEVSVFSGQRFITGGSSRTLVELSAIDTNNGMFSVRAPHGTATSSYYSLSRGTLSSAMTTSSYTAPTTNVLTLQAKISADANTLRIDGIFAVSYGVDQGTGNYGNYPMYFGSRANSGMFFYGNVYSVIVRGKLSTSQEITDTEHWVASKTGVTLP